MRPLSPDRWRRIEPILESALDLDENERAESLGRACGDDDELRAEVEALLESDVEAEHFLSGAVSEYAPTLLRAARAELDGAPEPLPASSTPSEPPGTRERHYLPGTVLAANRTVNATVTCEAGTALTAGDGFVVVSPGDLTFRAGQKIRLSKDFAVQSGTFKAEIDPNLEP